MSTVKCILRKVFQGTSLKSSEVVTVLIIPVQYLSASQGMGHDAHLATGFQRGMMGRGQIIQKLKNETGRLVWAAGSDPRADGHAAAQI